MYFMTRLDGGSSLPLQDDTKERWRAQNMIRTLKPSVPASPRLDLPATETGCWSDNNDIFLLRFTLGYSLSKTVHKKRLTTVLPLPVTKSNCLKCVFSSLGWRILGCWLRDYLTILYHLLTVCSVQCQIAYEWLIWKYVEENWRLVMVVFFMFF